MNIREWKNSSNFEGKYFWYQKTRSIQKSLKYNTDPSATVIHHLRDTEEQRDYNDTHYEFWGFNEDGTFEYGKYVVFVTQEQHSQMHMCSEETRRKISETETGKIVSHETRKKISKSCKGHVPPNKGIPHSAETRKKISENTRAAMTDEARKKCSEAHKGIRPSDETRKKMSESAKRRSDDNFCKKMSTLQSERMTEDYKKHLSEEMSNIMRRKKELYAQYKNSGGVLLWNDFQKYIKDNNLLETT